MIYENEKRWHPSAPFGKKQDAGFGQRPNTWDILDGPGLAKRPASVWLRRWDLKEALRAGNQANVF